MFLLIFVLMQPISPMFTRLVVIVGIETILIRENVVFALLLKIGVNCFFRSFLRGHLLMLSVVERHVKNLGSRV